MRDPYGMLAGHCPPPPLLCVASRGLVVLDEFLDELAPRVDGEDAGCGDPHLPVGCDILQRADNREGCWSKAYRQVGWTWLCAQGRGRTHIGPVPKGGVEGLSGSEELPDVTQAGDLEHFWFFLNHFPVWPVRWWPSQETLWPGS